MHRSFALFTFALVASATPNFAPTLASPSVAQDTVVRTADPIKRGLKESDFPRTIKVTDNVYTYEDFHAGDEKFTTTDMFVVTNDGVLLVDAQGSKNATQGLVQAIAKVTPKPIKILVIGSDHGDHTAGNAVLPSGIHYFVNPTSKAILDRQAAAATSGQSPREAPWTVPADAELVPDRKTLTLGGEEFQILFLGRAHTGGDLAVYLPSQKILFLSEIFLNRVFPAMRSAYPAEWVETLKKAEAMDVNIFIAGHGFTEKGPVSKEEIREYHKALVAVIAEATRLYKAGVPVDDAIKQANFGEYSSWTLAQSQGPIAIRRVYDELAGRLK
ncbi:MAG TPA: MBL fold metallo-hydrolase [Vicinamibacterales bacterium]|jgi:cyclase|nr:MBL fold metallo-hydrolase [Vicinamibacterales bacterium]